LIAGLQEDLRLLRERRHADEDRHLAEVRQLNEDRRKTEERADQAGVRAALEIDRARQEAKNERGARLRLERLLEEHKQSSQAQQQQASEREAELMQQGEAHERLITQLQQAQQTLEGELAQRVKQLELATQGQAARAVQPRGGQAKSPGTGEPSGKTRARPCPALGGAARRRRRAAAAAWLIWAECRASAPGSRALLRPPFQRRQCHQRGRQAENGRQLPYFHGRSDRRRVDRSDEQSLQDGAPPRPRPTVGLAELGEKCFYLIDADYI
jgi:hypothetical protein